MPSVTTTTSDRWLSPLRYPGGKGRMSLWLAERFWHQYGPMDIEVWVEPFAGGAGAALAAVERHDVPEAWLVERNPALAAFWRCLLTDGDRFADRIEGTRVDLALFGWAREQVAAACRGEAPLLTEGDVTDLAMAVFVVNRCSRSGIVSGNVGPIGGKHQTGRWKIDSRWNPQALAERIRRVFALAPQLRLIEGDGIEYLQELSSSGVEDEVFVFADPPYVEQGDALYAQSMTGADHARLAQALQALPGPWVATYDAHPAVVTMYRHQRIWEFDIPHSSNLSTIGSEYLILGDALFDPTPGTNPLGKRSVRCLTRAMVEREELAGALPLTGM